MDFPSGLLRNGRTIMIIVILLLVIVGFFASIYVLPPQFLRTRLEDMLGLSKGREEKYTEILQKDPDNIEALAYLGALRIKEQNYEDAYDHYSHLMVALRTVPEARSKINSFEVYLNFGIAAYQQDKKSEALTSLQKARLNLNSSETSNLFYYLGILHYENKNYHEACSPLHHTFNQRKDDKEIALYLGISYFKTGSYDSARSILQRFAEELGEGSYYFALSLARQEQYDAAIEQFEKFPKDSAFIIPAQYQIAKLCLKEEERTKEALQACMKIIDTCKTVVGMNLTEQAPSQKSSQESSAEPTLTEGTSAAPIEKPLQPLHERYYKELCFAHLHGSKLLAAKGKLEQACALLSPLLAMEPNYPHAAKLNKYYQQSLDNPQLFKILDCSKEVRERVAKKLISLLVGDLQNAEVINIKNLNIEVTAKKIDGSKHYLWISLQDSQVNIRQVYHAHNNSKQRGCKHCIIAALSPFSRDVESYIEGREILLVQGAELRKLIKQTAS